MCFTCSLPFSRHAMTLSAGRSCAHGYASLTLDRIEEACELFSHQRNGVLKMAITI